MSFVGVFEHRVALSPTLMPADCHQVETASLIHLGVYHSFGHNQICYSPCFTRISNRLWHAQKNTSRFTMFSCGNHDTISLESLDSWAAMFPNAIQSSVSKTHAAFEIESVMHCFFFCGKHSCFSLNEN